MGRRVRCLHVRCGWWHIAFNGSTAAQEHANATGHRVFAWRR